MSAVRYWIMQTPAIPWMGIPNNSISEGSWNPSPQVARTVSESSNGCQRTPNFRHQHIGIVIPEVFEARRRGKLQRM